MPKSILLVEDDETIRAAMRDALEIEGYEVKEAQHGQEALEVLQSEKADLILLDMRMPVLDGRGFLEERSRHPSILVIPVIIISATAGAGDLEGSVGFLRKPLDLDKLFEAISNNI